MKIGIFSDTHLGNTMYKDQNLPLGDRYYGRKEDYKDTFLEAIEIFLEVRVDWVFHLGDLIEAKAEGEIYNESLKIAIGGIKELISNRTRVLLIEGNHDFVKSHSKENRAFSIIEMSLRKEMENGDVFVIRAGEYGLLKLNEDKPNLLAFGYFDERDIMPFVNILREKSSEVGNSILLTHQSLGEDVPHHVLKYSEIPSNFKLILNGHIHKPRIKYLEGRVFINPGSTEYENASESIDYRDTLNERDDKRLLKKILKGVYVLEDLRLSAHGIDPDMSIPKDMLDDKNFRILKRCRPFLSFDDGDWQGLRKALERIRDLGLKPPYLVYTPSDYSKESSNLENLKKFGLLEGVIVRHVYQKSEDITGGESKRITTFGDLQEVRHYRRLISMLGECRDEEEFEEIIKNFFGISAL